MRPLYTILGLHKFFHNFWSCLGTLTNFLITQGVFYKMCFLFPFLFLLLLLLAMDRPCRRWSCRLLPPYLLVGDKTQAALSCSLSPLSSSLSPPSFVEPVVAGTLAPPPPPSAGILGRPRRIEDHHRHRREFLFLLLKSCLPGRRQSGESCRRRPPPTAGAVHVLVAIWPTRTSPTTPSSSW